MRQLPRNLASTSVYQLYGKNYHVFRQGNKLEKLNLELKDTKEKLLNQSESASNNTKDLDDRPPHY